MIMFLWRLLSQRDECSGLGWRGVGGWKGLEVELTFPAKSIKVALIMQAFN